MSLLHNTDIQSIVDNNIHGKIARIGGRMNQLINYENGKVTDINIVDGGYGLVRNSLSLKSFKTFYKTNKRRLRQELVWLLHGEREMRDRKTIILDMHFAYLDDSLKNKFDNVISSNVIEHSPNPIWFLLNFHFIAKENGYQFHAIPNYRYTFDQYRKPTPISHIIEDFEKMIWFEDDSHNEDYIMSAIEKHGHQRSFHEKYPVSYPFMHFHVFDENNVKELLQFMFEEVTVDCLRNEKFGDNVVIFKNKINAEFAKKYSVHIDSFKAFVIEKAKTADYSRRQN
jgi:hypothetical protein